MAIAALLLWMCTAAAGTYMLAARARAPQTPEMREAVATPKAGKRDSFDPPSLARAKSEPLPGLRALAEFAHPALALTGLGFWVGYVMTRDRLFAAIGFGVLLGAISAGVSWVASNSRAARASKENALSLSRRLLMLHATGAALTLLIAALIFARA